MQSSRGCPSPPHRSHGPVDGAGPRPVARVSEEDFSQVNVFFLSRDLGKISLPYVNVWANPSRNPVRGCIVTLIFRIMSGLFVPPSAEFTWLCAGWDRTRLRRSRVAVRCCIGNKSIRGRACVRDSGWHWVMARRCALKPQDTAQDPWFRGSNSQAAWIHSRLGARRDVDHQMAWRVARNVLCCSSQQKFA